MLHIEKERDWHVKGIVFTFVVLGLFAAGVYILVLSFAPMMILEPLTGRQPNATQKKLEESPGPAGNRLYIPQINVDVAIVTGSTEAALEKGAWHRHPENGDPVKGGNFVLSAHRFVMALTPQGVAERSPFYNINKLIVGDHIFVDFDGKRYAYELKRIYSVKPDAVEVEAPSTDAKLTLYSCTLAGSADGRDVIEAVKIGEVNKVSVHE